MSDKNDKLIKLMEVDNTYPDPKDVDFQSKIYSKREYNYHTIPQRKEATEYKDIKEQRDKLCGRKFALYDHQALLANFINPQTPYKGLLVCHGTGTGKCLLPETLVLINNVYYPINSIWQQYYNPNKIIDDAEGTWLSIDPKLNVNCINANSKTEIRPVKRLYRQHISELIKVVHLENGITIKTTQSHKFMTEKGWKSDLLDVKYIYAPSQPLYVETNSKNELTSKTLSENDIINFAKTFIKDISILATYNFNLSLNKILDKKEYIDIFNEELYHFDEFECGTYDIAIQLQHILSYAKKYTSINYNEISKKFDLKIIPIIMFDNDALLHRITSVEYEYYQGYVYDMEIDTTHSFVANNLYVSNTCLGITIAEQFKELVYKYETKIYILVSGPLIKESWKNSIISCTGETYLKQQDATVFVSDAERAKQKKNAINIALQYYRFMSYRSFYKKVLGEKIAETQYTKDNKIKKTHRKDKDGEYERDIPIDRIYNLNNSLIIVDEAHNLTDNSYGDAFAKIVKNSSNLKILLLSATPMKNLASDIIQLINFIRPTDEPMERDKIFTSHKNHEMELKEGGIEYFKKMTKGYLSYLRGADPLTFAERVEMGKIPDGLLFTKLTRCRMLPFQEKVYMEAAEVEEEDALDRRSEAIANFAFPGLSDDRKGVKGYFSTKGITVIKNQIKSDSEALSKKIATEILGLDPSDLKEDMLQISDNQKSVTGLIMKKEYLKNFSIKFYRALKKINRLFYQKKGARTAFVYSNLVRVGIELFQEILLKNGYLEYDDNSTNYKIANDTICYYCGKTYLEHKQNKLKQAIQNRTTSQSRSASTSSVSINTSDLLSTVEKDSESSSEYANKDKEIIIPDHVFHPATFITVTGKSTDDVEDVVPEEKQRLLDNVFSNIENREGKYIKLVLGSKVMNEGISLKNVAEVHILDVYYNLGKVDQVIGRGIRNCSHYGIINDKNRYPVVKIYKYAVGLEKGLSSEEELYQKAEHKYLLIKKIEKAIKEVAFDCPINRHGNIFPEEVTRYKKCVEPTDPNPNNEEICPSVCGYTRCDYKCDELALNEKYFDPIKNTYKKLSIGELDYSTFSHILMRNEIENVKSKIKDMYRVKFDYTLEQILDYVQNSYDAEKKELFETFFVYQALNEMIPLTENDFNNFKDTVFNKFNQPGYLIYINKYYIFQPFSQNENVPMYYRSNFDKKVNQNLTLYNYIKNNQKFKNIKAINSEITEENPSVKNVGYNFDNSIEYYNSRDEYKYVGIIDKESSRKKIKQLDQLEDEFKIRPPRAKILDKKRGTGIPSLTGSVCATSKDKETLANIAKEIGIKLEGNEIRKSICEIIQNRLIFLEKYSTTKKKNKKTYIMVPDNHPVYKFPLNLEDRVEHIKTQIKDRIKFKINLSVKTIETKIEKETVETYVITIINDKQLDDFVDFLQGLGAKKIKDKWEIVVD